VQGQPQPSNQPARVRLEGERGQRVIEVGLVETVAAQAIRGGPGLQSEQGGLMGHAEKNEGVGRGMPVPNDIGVGDGEVEGRVRQLAGLHRGRQIGPGDQVQAGNESLTVSHGPESTRPRKPVPTRDPSVHSGH